jgi:hypothetical protein
MRRRAGGAETSIDRRRTDAKGRNWLGALESSLGGIAESWALARRCEPAPSKDGERSRARSMRDHAGPPGDRKARARRRRQRPVNLKKFNRRQKPRRLKL